jgi:carbonic anhydrase
MKTTLILLLMAAMFGNASAAEKPGAKGSKSPRETDPLTGVVRNLLQDNRDFVKTHKASYFAGFADGQHPRATVVTCADSQVQMHAMDKTPDNDLFVVRNIGNQLATAEGSVEYGVHHLHTPLLIFIGHVACDAIKAASGDYSQEADSIRRELDTIDIVKGGDWLENVKINVHRQVTAAVSKYRDDVRDGKLTVIGAIYDFRNDLKQGQGKLVIININGVTDPDAIQQAPYLSAK